MSKQTAPDAIDGEQDARFVQPLPVLLLREQQAAQVLSIGERTLWDLADRGEIPVVYIGSSKRYRLSDLQEWVSSRPTGKPASPGA